MSEPQEQESIRYPAWYVRNRERIVFIAKLTSLTSGLAVMAAMFFMIRQERAFDESKCPYQRVESREIEGRVVQEDARECVPGTVEHRWQLVRDGQTLELGRRRLKATRFSEGNYAWRAFTEGEHVRVHVQVEGLSPVTYREEIARNGPAPVKMR